MATPLHFDNLPAASFLRIPAVLQITGKSKAAYYKAAREGRAPAPEKLGGSRSSGVRVGKLREWLDDPCGYRARPAVGGAT